MCGLAGVVRRQGPVAQDAAALAELLGTSLAHRGPDGSGWWLAPQRDVLLVHRRLAIIGPGPDAAQPMATADLRHHLVFNGEIYNYRELGRDLETRGERFRTGSDTEVLLRMLTRDGPGALTRLRGMFALALWDATERSLLLARDRFGIKPLYVADTPHQIAFASELGALRRARLIDGEPSASGILAFLSWGSVPAPLTWQRGVEMLPPGGWRIWRQDGRDERGLFASTRDAYRSQGRRPARQALAHAVGHAVRESVRAHLVADVPVGVFLSGGVDSAAIVSVASSMCATPLQTFTVGFRDPSSEAARARQVAAAFGTDHHDLTVDASAIAADFPRILEHLDQPSIDGVNTYCVAGAVARTGVKAVLSGVGADELFGGYPSFTRLPRAVGAAQAVSAIWPLAAALAGAMVPRRLEARWRHFAGSNRQFADAYRAQRGFLMPDEALAFAGPALRDPSVWREASEELDGVEQRWLAPAAAEQPSAAVARLESRWYLSSQLLRDIDVMSMAHGIEVRVPYIDHELLETVWPDLGFHAALVRRKRILHETLDRPLPENIVRQSKKGFTLPFARWIGGELAPAVQDGMRQLSESGWIGREVPDGVWRAWTSGTMHWTRPWGLAVLGHLVSSCHQHRVHV